MSVFWAVRVLVAHGDLLKCPASEHSEQLGKRILTRAGNRIVTEVGKRISPGLRRRSCSAWEEDPQQEDDPCQAGGEDPQQAGNLGHRTSPHTLAWGTWQSVQE